MSAQEDDLDLLLSLQDRVLETPPASPSTHSSGYPSDDDYTKRTGQQADMSVFRNAVQDCLDYEPATSKKSLKSNQVKSSSDAEVEKFSGLRIRNQLVSQTELSDRFADIRFVRLTAIKNLVAGETLSGCWATVGVLCEKGMKRASSTGKPYCIWNIGCLDENTISLFLFGNAYEKNCNEEKEGFTLSVFSAPQVLKMGTSADFGHCESCTQVINKRRGRFCKEHRKKTSQKYSTKRTEFMGGNLRTAFRFSNRMQSEGIYMVENRTNVANPGQPKKVLSVEGLKRALSNAGKVTTNAYSQGIRFLSEVAGKPSSSLNQPIKSSDKRKSFAVGSNLPEVKTSQQLNAKRVKIEKGQAPAAAKTQQVKEKMIELELLSSDDEL